VRVVTELVGVAENATFSRSLIFNTWLEYDRKRRTPLP